MHFSQFIRFLLFSFMFLFVVGAEAQAGQKPQNAHHCICWQPSGGQRKRSELTSNVIQCVLLIYTWLCITHQILDLGHFYINNQEGDFQQYQTSLDGMVNIFLGKRPGHHTLT